MFMYNNAKCCEQLSHGFACFNQYLEKRRRAKWPYNIEPIVEYLQLLCIIEHFIGAKLEHQNIKLIRVVNVKCNKECSRHSSSLPLKYIAK
jgi:hypothetical protein